MLTSEVRIVAVAVALVAVAAGAAYFYASKKSKGIINFFSFTFLPFLTA